ncbi:hypothetical protein MNBD_GAMMA17-1633 [hydrothermal vent metagenome]|uniref:Ketosynthase family 3 (KS3) domain-containing protein n=1 Tax=hydrothermal vent metagenome TaxID=652676 RepID=A0A3B0Z9L3_9ZZZZ
MPDEVYFIGSGLITALGDSVERNLSAINNMDSMHTSVSIQLGADKISLPYFLINTPPSEQRIDQLINSVINQALMESGLNSKEKSALGVFLGSTSYDIYNHEIAIKSSRLTDINIAENIPPFSSLADFICKEFNINGPVYTFNTACTSSANALMYAAESIRSGEIEHALVLGVEFYNEMTALGFEGLELISRAGMQPFNKNRDGLYLGEACGAIILSKEAAEHNFSYISGATLSDNHSITACKPDGSSIAKVIKQALQRANICDNEIKAVKAHGTASLSNDKAEALGLQLTFSTIPPVSVIKPVIGHTLGACGVVELILFYQSIINNQSLAFGRPDSSNEDSILELTNSSYRPDAGYFLLNYFGFGGSNTSLVISNV